LRDAIEILNRRYHAIAVFIREDKLFRQPCARGILPARFVPAGPQPVDVAVVQPEDWITCSPRYAAHVLRITHQHMHVAMKATIDFHVEPRLGSVWLVFTLRQRC